MFCKNCGNTIEANATFCANCGLRLREMTPGRSEGERRFTYPDENIMPAERDDDYPPNAYTNLAQGAMDSDDVSAPVESVFPEVITEEDTAQYTSEGTSLAGQISGLTARREELEQQTGGSDIPEDDWASGIYGQGGYLELPSRSSSAEVERVFFGKGALAFCLTVIGLLSVTCGIFAGLYFSVI